MRTFILVLLMLIATPALAHYWVFVGSSNDYPLLSAISGLDVECDLDTSSPISYPGTGTTWTSLAGSNCDMTISGFAFTDNAGTSDDSFDVDAGDFAYIGTNRDSAAAHPDFITDMGRGNCATDTCDWWAAWVFEAGDDPQAALSYLGGNLRNSSGVLQTNGFWIRNDGTGNLRFRHTNGEFEPYTDDEFVLLPQQEHVVIFSYDDSANKLSLYFNAYEPIDLTMDVGTASGSPTAAFHLLAVGDDNHSFSNMDLYAFSGGEGYVDEDLAKEIMAVYNDRRDRTLVPTEECHRSFDCIAQSVFFVDMANKLSWAEGDVEVNNLISVPYDGVSQANYDFSIVNSPVFVGPAGVPGTYMSTSNNGHLSLALTASVPALDSAMDHTAGANTWCAVAAKTPTGIAAGKYALFGNAADAETGAMGWGIHYESGVIRLNYHNGATDEAHPITQTLTADTDYNFLVGLNTYDTTDGVHDTHVLYLDNATRDGLSNDIDDVNNGVTDATGNFIIGGNWDVSAASVDDYWSTGGGIYAMGCSQTLLTDAIAKRTQRLLEKVRYADIDGDGGIGTIGGEAFRGRHLLVAKANTSASIVSSVSGGGYDGLVFEFPNTPTEIVVLRGIAVLESGSNVVDTLTSVTWGDTNDFTDIVAGEYTAGFFNVERNIHLYNNTASTTGDVNETSKVYMEFASTIDPANITGIYICMDTSASNGLVDVTIRDQNGTALTFTNEPVDRLDNEGNNTHVVDGALCSKESYEYLIN